MYSGALRAMQIVGAYSEKSVLSITAVNVTNTANAIAIGTGMVMMASADTPPSVHREKGKP
ncbi:hypothetical protein FIBSPDRAFT_876864, partial [Athelia psychrophila]